MLDNQNSESEMDLSAFVSLLFSHDASNSCLLRSSEYDDPIYGIKLRNTIGKLLQILPDDPELAAICAAHAREAISTCQDKVILKFRDCAQAATISTLFKTENPLRISN